MSNMSDLLVIAPSVHVVAKTTFDEAGLDGWVSERGFAESELYADSPIKRIVEGGTAITEAQDESEIVSELGGRFCYDSFLKGRDSADYLRNVIEMAHGSVLEHVNYTFLIEGVSRSLTHELIRHRAGFAVSQESQRYVDAKNIRFVVPPLLLAQCGGDLDHPRIQKFAERCERALGDYMQEQEAYVEAFELEAEETGNVKSKTIIKKRANEAARSMLPNASETKLMWTGNLRSLRHFIELRGDGPADLEIRRLAVAIADKMLDRAPYSMFDVAIREGDFGVEETVVGTHKV